MQPLYPHLSEYIWQVTMDKSQRVNVVLYIFRSVALNT